MEEQLITHRQEDQRKDSIEIGTASKGGGVKVYVDLTRPDEARRLIDNAYELLQYTRTKWGV